MLDKFNELYAKIIAENIENCNKKTNCGPECSAECDGNECDKNVNSDETSEDEGVDDESGEGCKDNKQCTTKKCK